MNRNVIRYELVLAGEFVHGDLLVKTGVYDDLDVWERHRRFRNIRGQDDQLPERVHNRGLLLVLNFGVELDYLKFFLKAAVRKHLVQPRNLSCPRKEDEHVFRDFREQSLQLLDNSLIKLRLILLERQRFLPAI